MRSGSGFHSQRSRRLHFGLLEDEKPLALRVRWPNGAEQRFADLPSSGFLRLREGRARAETITFQTPAREAKQDAADAAAPNPGEVWLATPVPVPDFELLSLDGKTRRLSELRGSTTLVNFWATWCPPCRAELRDLSGAYSRFQEAGVEILAVSVDEPGERDLPFPVLFADEETVSAYTVLNRNLFDRRRDLAIPTSFLIDEKGRIAKLYLGAANSSRILADVREGGGPSIPFAGEWILGRPRRDFVEMATAMAERGLNRQAMRYFEAAVAQGAAGHELYNNMAAALLDQGELERAEELLLRSLTINPSQSEARVNLGQALAAQGKHSEAAEAFAAALELQPDDAYLHDALGSSQFALGDAAEAESNYREAIRLDPSSADYPFNLGSLLAGRGDFGRARIYFEQALRLGRNDAKTLTNLAIVSIETGDRETALDYFRRAIDADPSDPGSRLNLALYYVREGDAEEAKRIVEELLETSPDFQPAVELLRQLR